MVLHIPKDGDLVTKVFSVAAAKTFHSVDRIGLPARTWTTRFVQKLMGDLAVATVAQYLKDALGMTVTDYDALRTDEYKLRDPGWDLALAKSKHSIIRGHTAWHQPNDVCTISVKCSQLPKSDGSYYDAVRRRDFKVFAYSAELLADLHADLECQVYLPHQRKEPPSVAEGELRLAISDLNVAGNLVQRFKPNELWSEFYLVGFCTAQRLQKYSSELPEGKRRFKMPGYGKTFWALPLRELATSPPRIGEIVEWILMRKHAAPQPIDPRVDVA
jgi:hypothetical protein